MVSNSSNASLGEHVIVGGHFVQIIFFGIYTIMAIVFQARMAKEPTTCSPELTGIRQRHMLALYICSGLILVRSVIRVVEYIQGYDRYLMRKAACIYIFDALLMFATMIVLQYLHPSEASCWLGRGKRYCEYVKTHRFIFVPL